MDGYLFAGVLMLAVWAGLLLTTDVPGWMHLLLTGGVFVIIWRIVVRGTSPTKPKR